MFDFLSPSKVFNLRQPETLWLQPKHFEQAIVFSNNDSALPEVDRWQLYLNRLALLGFEEWLKKASSWYSIDKTQCMNEVDALYHLQINKFKLNLIIKEHILDEEVEIPLVAIPPDGDSCIEQSHAAHFYVLLEITEEQQQLMIRGFLRYDRLINYCLQNDTLHNNHYKIPLAIFDPEPQHLLFNCDFLDPDAIMPPVTLKPNNRINLGEWISGASAVGWQTIDALFGAPSQLASSLRQPKQGDSRGKLIDLGLQLQEHQVVLLVNVTEADTQELTVLVQLHPVGDERYLPAQITLTLLAQSGEKLQEVQARSLDNYIQLRSFQGLSGTLFQLMVSLGKLSVLENFEL
jgi:Protein of unknown function (DUF1822)